MVGLMYLHAGKGSRGCLHEHRLTFVWVARVSVCIDSSDPQLREYRLTVSEAVPEKLPDPRLAGLHLPSLPGHIHHRMCST